VGGSMKARSTAAVGAVRQPPAGQPTTLLSPPPPPPPGSCTRPAAGGRRRALTEGRRRRNHPTVVVPRSSQCRVSPAPPPSRRTPPPTAACLSTRRPVHPPANLHTPADGGLPRAVWNVGQRAARHAPPKPPTHPPPGVASSCPRLFVPLHVPPSGTPALPPPPAPPRRLAPYTPWQPSPNTHAAAVRPAAAGRQHRPVTRAHVPCTLSTGSGEGGTRKKGGRGGVVAARQRRVHAPLAPPPHPTTLARQRPWHGAHTTRRSSCSSPRHLPRASGGGVRGGSPLHAARRQ